MDGRDRWRVREDAGRTIEAFNWIERTLVRQATAIKIRNWRVSILRNRAEYLGIVEAADAAAAEGSYCSVLSCAKELGSKSGSRIAAR